MDQLKPRLFIPTHSSLHELHIAAGKWPPLFSDQAFVSIGRGDLTDQTRILFPGAPAPSYGKLAAAEKNRLMTRKPSPADSCFYGDGQRQVPRSGGISAGGRSQQMDGAGKWKIP
jgi:hypothetical protein